MALKVSPSFFIAFFCFLFVFAVLSLRNGGLVRADLVVSGDPRELVLGENPESILRADAPPAVLVDIAQPVTDDTVQILRFNDEIKVSLASVTSLKELLQMARDKFGDFRITRFVTRTGDDINSLEAIKRLPKVTQVDTKDSLTSIIAKGDNERFMWSAWKVGEEIPIKLHGRDVVVRTLATNPRLFEIDNLIDPTECDHIIKKATEYGLVQSRVGDTAELAQLDPSRTSSQLWVGPSQRNDDQVFASIRNRVVNLTKLSNDLCEDTQVVYYDVEQHYYAHHDFTRKEYVLDNPYYQAGGNRLVTVIYYLNDVEEGGETGFPYVNSHTNPFIGIEDYAKTCSYGLNLKPKKGGAAMFYNLVEDGHMDGETDPWSLHSGCDVLKGVKWIANQWIRNKRVNGYLFSDTY
eukprot:TRINITY_DN2066_c0_g1_i1.p1 TRINITY_DN2066_c0_g1~~TRINITY_DN2066_c0_g1_i1.p1  ORF type:complete len:407 (-),score=94.83 TRINITY_DN2066_c0_g1_i1:125-1345(-)